MLLVFNPKSGRGKFSQSLYEVIDVFSRAGYEVVVYSTTARDDARTCIQTRAANFDLIVCSGGMVSSTKLLTPIGALKSDSPLAKSRLNVQKRNSEYTYYFLFHL